MYRAFVLSTTNLFLTVVYDCLLGYIWLICFSTACKRTYIFSRKGKIPTEGNGIGSRNPDAQKNMSLIYHQTAIKSQKIRQNKYVDIIMATKKLEQLNTTQSKFEWRTGYWCLCFWFIAWKRSDSLAPLMAHIVRLCQRRQWWRICM